MYTLIFKDVDSTMFVRLILVGISLIRGYPVKGDDFFSNYEEVPSPPPQSIGAIPKCGEGVQQGKFKCVPYFNCDLSTNTIVDYPEVDGSNSINPRLQVVEPVCRHPLQVCCRITNSTDIPTHHVPTVDLAFEPKCGLKNEQFPWMVALLNASDTKARPFCGGSLLTPVVVLTAAHCLRNFQAYQIKIRAGESTGEKIPHQERTVSEIIVHEHHSASTLYNDVAIVILNSSLTKADNVGTVCLPKNVENINQNCFVTGWGKESDATPYPNVMKKIDVSLITNENCERAFRKEIGNEFILDDSFICANGDDGKNTCMGDGGGPMVCQDSSQRYFQIGIVSWGLSCGDVPIPGVYTNVTLFRDWIDKILIELGYNSKPYTA